MRKATATFLGGHSKNPTSDRRVPKPPTTPTIGCFLSFCDFLPFFFVLEFRNLFCMFCFYCASCPTPREPWIHGYLQINYGYSKFLLHIYLYTIIHLSIQYT